VKITKEDLKFKFVKDKGYKVPESQKYKNDIKERRKSSKFPTISSKQNFNKRRRTLQTNMEKLQK